MINWERVHELRDEIGEEDFAEIVALFLEEVEEVLLRIRASADPGTYSEDLHFLKGSALNLGFRSLSSLCTAKEREVAENPATSLNFDPLHLAYERSKAEFMTNGYSSNQAHTAP